MKERPILFSAPMVRAILAGQKTQTRRVVKERPPYVEKFCPANGISWDGFVRAICPYGQPGDRLWVRETFGEFIDTDVINGVTHELGRDWVYRADGDSVRVSTNWKPSIHMPRAASRILLEIVSVRVERLQHISTQDIIAEGLSTTLREYDAECDLRDQWKKLWIDINGPGSWDANPWVWVIKFKRVLP